MLINSREIIERLNARVTEPVNRTNSEGDGNQGPIVLQSSMQDAEFVDARQVLTRSINKIAVGKAVHYYSYGNFNLVRLIVHLIKQTGPVNIFMTSYSFSQKSIDQILNQQKKGNILSFKVIVDNRVKSMSPKPFQMLSSVFDYRCSAIHAKVALLWNDEWKLSIITSQNATDNPKMERGTIFTDSEVFNFDLKALTNEFNRGTL